MEISLASSTSEALPMGPTMSRALAELAIGAGATMNDIALWVWGRVPGAGPETEAALTFLRKIATQLGRPVVEVSSLEVMAIEVFRMNFGLNGVIVPILPGTRAGYFRAGAYQLAEKTPQSAPRVILHDKEYSIDQLKAALIAAKKAPASRPRLMGPSLAMAPAWVGCGVGYLRVAEALREILRPVDLTNALPVFSPSLATLAHTAYQLSHRHE
jgi:hypothetical protein